MGLSINLDKEFTSLKQYAPVIYKEDLHHKTKKVRHYNILIEIPCTFSIESLIEHLILIFSHLRINNIFTKNINNQDMICIDFACEDSEGMTKECFMEFEVEYAKIN